MLNDYAGRDLRGPETDEQKHNTWLSSCDFDFKRQSMVNGQHPQPNESVANICYEGQSTQITKITFSYQPWMLSFSWHLQYFSEALRSWLNEWQSPENVVTKSLSVKNSADLLHQNCQVKSILFILSWIITKVISGHFSCRAGLDHILFIYKNPVCELCHAFWGSSLFFVGEGGLHVPQRGLTLWLLQTFRAASM